MKVPSLARTGCCGEVASRPDYPSEASRDVCGGLSDGHGGGVGSLLLPWHRARPYRGGVGGQEKNRESSVHGDKRWRDGLQKKRHGSRSFGLIHGFAVACATIGHPICEFYTLIVSEGQGWQQKE